MSGHQTTSCSLRQQNKSVWHYMPYVIAWTVLACASSTFAQSTPPPAGGEEQNKTLGGYVVRQSIEFGGRISDSSGSQELWNTFVNLHSGPRLMNYELEMRSGDHKGFLFDDLSTSSFGYGGDPNSVSLLRFSKDKWYSFNGTFRRDRNYWDYNLLANPLNPQTSNPAVPIATSPHLFNTVRRMGNYNLAIRPQSPVTVRLGYTHNVSEGPTFTTLHEGTETLLFQPWRNNLHTYQMGIDFKMLPRTSISYDQFIARQKGDTSQTEAAFGYQLSTGQLVDLGLPFNTAAGQPCAAPVTVSTTTPPTANPTCNGTTAYNRSAHVRSLFPTEQLSFASNYFKHVEFSGRLLYSASESNVSDFSEFFQGLLSRNRISQDLITGPMSSRRINVSSDFGITWRITDKLRFNDTFRWIDSRMPGRMDTAEASLFSTSMLIPAKIFNPATCPGPLFNAATCPQHSTSSSADLISQTSIRFLGQDSKLNTAEFEFEPTHNLGFRLGYRYRNRLIGDRSDDITVSTFFPNTAKRGVCIAGPVLADGTCVNTTIVSDGDETEINEHSLLFGFNARIREKFRTNFDMELMSADKVFTRISPRQMQHYKLRTNFKPVSWANLGMSINIQEKRNNVTDVNNLQHNRNYAFTAVFPGSDNWSIDVDYGFNDVFSQTNICFVSTPIPAGTTNCSTVGFLSGISFYSNTTHFMSTHFMWKPVRRLTTQLGYSANFVNGQTLILNPLSPLGPLQFNYHLPSAEIAYEMQKNWTWRAGWNYYGYNEKQDPGFTAPRDFRGNVVTLALRYAF